MKALKKVKDSLNGNTGIVVTSGLIIFIIALVTFSWSWQARLEARMINISESCIEKKIEPMRTDVATIKADNQWMKDSLKRIEEALEKHINK